MSRLNEFEATYVFDGNAYTLTVWVVNEKAARESVESYALETHGPGFQVRRIRKVTP